MQVLNALGYGLFVAVINLLLLGLVSIWVKMDGSFVLGCCLGVGLGNALMFYLGFVGK